MKTAEEIKKGLECCNQKCVGDKFCPYDEYSNACENTLHKDALVYIQQLEAENERLLNSFDAALCETADMHSISKEAEAQVPRWISVEERLPDTQQQILFIAASGLKVVGKFSHIGKTGVIWFRSGRGKSSVTYHATYWIPLPEAPKEGV